MNLDFADIRGFFYGSCFLCKASQEAFHYDSEEINCHFIEKALWFKAEKRGKEFFPVQMQ